MEQRTLLTTFTVDSLEDVSDADFSAGNFTLREAIEQANLAGDADTILFDADLFTSGDATIELTQFDTGTDSNEFGATAFIITTEIEIIGPGGDNGLTIERTGNNDFRLFHVTATGDLSLSNMNLVGGVAQGGDGGTGGGGGAGGFGGGIFNQGALSIEGVTLTENSAIGGGGGLANRAAGGGGGGVGAAGANGGTGDQSFGGVGGGPNGGTASSRDGGDADDGGGGGGGQNQFNVGSNGFGGDGGNGGFGGGGGGGGFGNSTGGGPSSIGGDGGAGGFGAGGGGGGTARSGAGSETPGSGGAGGFGGAAGRNGTTGLNNNGAGGGGAGMGGAIFNDGGTIDVINSTISGNTAQGGETVDYGTPSINPGGDGLGGGIFNRNGTVTITNATIANNTVAGGRSTTTAGSAAGGGIYNLGDGAVGTVTLNNTIVANSTGGGDFFGNSINAGANSTMGVGNLIESQTGFAGSITSSNDPLLGALSDNRGPTLTHALLDDSPAIDTGNAAAAVGLTTDQRGGIFQRVADGDLNGSSVVDIGAFERLDIDYGDAPDFITGVGPANILVGISDNIRVSVMGNDAEGVSTVRDDFRATSSHVAYNATDNEFLVVWYGDDDTAPLVDGENEIFGRRINASTGAQIGSQFRISTMGTNGDTAIFAFDPSVAWNSVRNEYYVVWHSDDTNAPVVDNEFEIFGRRLSNTGALLGVQTRISVMGNDAEGDPTVRDDFRAQEADIAYNATDDEYLVVWHGDTDTGSLVDNENEVFGHRIDGDGTLLGSQIRVSVMGDDSEADPTVRDNYFASRASVEWNSVNNQYMVIWESDGDGTDGLIDNEFEIFGQLVGNTGSLVGSQIRISTMGTNGDTAIRPQLSKLAYNPDDNEFLVVWQSDDDTGGVIDNESEIFGRRVNAQTGALLGSQFRISEIGGLGATNFAASSAEVSYNSATGNYLVVYHGDDTVDNKQQIHARRVSNTGTVLDAEEFLVGSTGDEEDTSFGSFTAAIAYNSVDNQFLVTWQGDDDTAPLVDNEQEIFGRLISDASIIDYATTGAEDGPAHKIDPDLRIGATVDADPNGQPSLQSNADDMAGLDDEDGIVTPGDLIDIAVGSAPAVTVAVTNNTGNAARLYGWIDTNRNGVFEVSERTFVDVPDGTDGNVVLNFPTVASDPGGPTVARFRLGTINAEVEVPTGVASDGEVEDYVATFSAPSGAEIGDFVFVDVDRDGVQDPMETGLRISGGMTVNLWSPGDNGVIGGGDDSIIATTQTNKFGVYNFSGVATGDYFLEFVLPARHVFSPQNVGNWKLDSDADPNTGLTSVFSVTEGDTDFTRDAGVTPFGEIGDRVWVDTNGNGILDGPEKGARNVTVTLFDAGDDGMIGGVDDVQVATINTNKWGQYNFDNLFTGNYYVEFTLPTGFVFSPQGAVMNDAIDSDADVVSGRTDVINLAPGERDNTQDAGIVELGKIGDRVFVDTNGNGQFNEPAEEGLRVPGGMTVNLLTVGANNSIGGGDDDLVGTTKTNKWGGYRFEQVQEGRYYLQFVLPNGFAFTTQNSGDWKSDSDVNPATGLTRAFNLALGKTDFTRDAGVIRLSPPVTAPPAENTGTTASVAKSGFAGLTPVKSTSAPVELANSDEDSSTASPFAETEDDDQLAALDELLSLSGGLDFS